ncbi:MAG: (2Fe-2S)-binding protein, partial [Clostridia bacterium]|nr:(2Fe-2S)-binding protein [Clostridia bacterium]
MQMINLKINGTPVSVPAGTTVLEAARQINIDIPTLCFLKEINAIGACRICVVENRVNGAGRLVAACVFPVAEGMEIYTHSPMVQKARKQTLELILSNHEKKCLSCIRSGDCELQRLCAEYGVDKEDAFGGEVNFYPEDDTAVHMVRNNNKCILCRRCVAVCDKLQGVSVIGANERGFATHIGSAFDDGLGLTSCVSCGQCIVACPTGALHEKDDTDKVWEALADPTKHVVVQVAPSIRVTLGEAFDMPIGTNVEGKMVTALKKLGFDKVFDTNLTADLTIMEEANELIER